MLPSHPLKQHLHLRCCRSQSVSWPPASRLPPASCCCLPIPKQICDAQLTSRDCETDADGQKKGGRKLRLHEALCAARQLKKLQAACSRQQGQMCTGPDRRMSHRKWRVTKQDPSRARPGTQLGCCLLSLHFMCDILQSSPVYGNKSRFLKWGPLVSISQ